jgi:hypothetical protein
MQQFHSHGVSCANMETKALNLAASGKPNTDDEEPFKPYTQMLDNLGTSPICQNKIFQLSPRLNKILLF